MNHHNGKIEPEVWKEALFILRNNFNYNQNIILNEQKQIKTLSLSTIKPKLNNFATEVNFFQIYDAYIAYCKINNQEKLIDLGIIPGSKKSQETSSIS